jgi:hypothetical protein
MKFSFAITRGKLECIVSSFIDCVFFWPRLLGKVRFVINREWNEVPTLLPWIKYVVRISPEARELFTAGNAVCTAGAGERVPYESDDVTNTCWHKGGVCTQRGLRVNVCRRLLCLSWTLVLWECHEINDIRIAVFCVLTTSRSLVGEFRRFGWTYFLSLEVGS